MRLFVILILIIPIAIDVYIWLCFRSILFNKISYLILFLAISLLSVSLICLPFIFSRGLISNSFFTIIYGVLFAIYISKIVLIIPLLLDHTVKIITFLSESLMCKTSNNTQNHDRLTFLQHTGVVLAGLSLSMFLYGIFIGRYKFKKHYVRVPSKRVTGKISNIKIVQISDLHLGSFHNQNKLIEVVDIINNENPDLIFFTGDLVNTFSDEAELYVNILRNMNAKFGMFSVLGNHDYADYAGIDKNSLDGQKQWDDNFNKMKDIHQRIGFDLLLNENRTLVLNGSEINIIGVENWGEGRFSKYGDFNKAKEGINNDNFTILLSHDPTHWKVILNNPTHVDLQMSGHTHGMQFGLEIPGIKWSPAQWKYPHWAGLYNNDAHFLYVNRGVGHLGYPGRVGILPEITICEIYSAS